MVQEGDGPIDPPVLGAQQPPAQQQPQPPAQQQPQPPAQQQPLPPAHLAPQLHQAAVATDRCSHCHDLMEADPGEAAMTKLAWRCGTLMCSRCARNPAAMPDQPTTARGMRCHNAACNDPACVLTWPYLLHWQLLIGAPQDALDALHLLMMHSIENAALQDQQAVLAIQQQTQEEQQQTTLEGMRTYLRLQLESLMTQRCGACTRVFGLELGHYECACLYCPAPCHANICAACSETYDKHEFPDSTTREIEAHDHVRKHCVYAASVEAEETYELTANQLSVARARRCVDRAREYRHSLANTYWPLHGPAAQVLFDGVASEVMAASEVLARSTAGTPWIGGDVWLQRTTADINVVEWLVQ